MADQLYLSLWFPNFRLETLPAALTCVLHQFARISGEARVTAAAVYPIAFSEAPTYQRLYVNDGRAEDNQDTAAANIEAAVAEATEQLHDDMAYEFEMQWKLWTPDTKPSEDIGLDTLWRAQPTTVRVLGFGPEFDEGEYEQNGHIRVDFGLDYPWTFANSDSDSDDDTDARADADPDETTANPANDRETGKLLTFSRTGPAGPDPTEPLSEDAQYIRRNVEMLLAFTLSVEKHCGISSRLLWTESGEPLAEKLIAQLQRLT